MLDGVITEADTCREFVTPRLVEAGWGAALRAARKHLGLTQPQLALAAGVGVLFIVELEAGKATVRLENVLRVIDALGGEIQLNGLAADSSAVDRLHQ